jgi:hypothetical protein
VREIEQRLDDKEEILERGRPKFDEENVRLEPQGKNGMQEHIELMMDLTALAFQTDMTRVVTHSLGGEGGPNYDDYKTWAKQAGAQLRGAHDFHHDGTLLDHTVLLLGGSQISSHSGGSFPMLLAGGKKLGFKHGQHLKWKGNERAASDLYLTILQQLGCPVTSFKESTGPISEILV